MTRRHLTPPAAVLACLLLPLLAQAAPFTAPLRSTPPTLDGRVDPTEWSAALSFDGFAWQGQLERRRVRAFLAATESHLYVAIQSQLPAEGELLSAVDKDIEKIVFDDSVEVWIDPTPGSEHGAAYQLLTNAKGRRYYALHPRGNTKADALWNGHWQVAHGLHDGWWHAEFAIPLSSIAPNRKASEGAWAINLCRNWKQPWAFSSLGGQAYAPGQDLLVRFSPAALAVHHEHRRDPVSGEVESILSLHNPTATPLTLRATQRLQRDTMPDVLIDEPLYLRPGASEEVVLRVSKEGTTRSMRLNLEVTSSAGQTVHYQRQTAWKVSSGIWAWRTTRHTKPPIDLQFAYYPYQSQMRLLADVSGLPANAKLDHLQVALRRASKPDEVLTTFRLDQFDDNRRQAMEFHLGGLDGAYELVATAIGSNVPKGEIVKPFERHEYEWERNDLGKSKTVFPPFAPLKRGFLGDDYVVRTALCEHRSNDLGLWNQVIATSAHTQVAKPILAAPMRYVVKAAGEQQRVEGRMGFPDCCGISAGPLGFVAQRNWDIDGLMEVRLHLGSAENATIDNLTLEIPFRDDAAPYMHAMAEGIRNSIVTQRVPPGQGVVWDSSKLPVQEFPKNFCTYIYVGSAVRGICFYSENDKGWSWDPSKPNVELVRDGQTLTLRIHLINKPLVIADGEERTITFGLQAAPIKPRLAATQNAKNSWRYRWYRDRYSLLGTDINWLALGDCGSVYPAGKDLHLWQMIKRGNTERLSDGEIQKLIEHGRKYWEPYGKGAIENFERHAHHNLRSRYGSKMVYYYNRASYQAADEFQTFQDEWGLTDYRAVGPGKSLGEIKIVPTPSYIDHALWWYAKSFEQGGNQGVYWDNWFIVPSQNTKMTDAYQRPDGSIMPAAGIMGLRELCRRTFQMMNERKMLPITMPHMTSTNILPLHGFATVQYDWEWKYSEGDVQYRFPREYILLVSNGELAGTWPVLLGDHGKLASDPWTQRTFAAVSIVHELDPAPNNLKVWKPLIDPIIALLDHPKLEVWRYWDERPQPATANHPDLPAIVYAIPGQQAIVAVTSYAEQDVDATLTIDPKPLGFAGAYTISDVETGQSLSLENNRAAFKLKKHDIREFRLTPK